MRNNRYATFDADDRIAFAANPAFDASTMEVWAALLNGGALVVIAPEVMMEAERLAAELQRHRITTLFLTTALFNQYVHSISGALAQLKYLISGGRKRIRALMRGCCKSGAGAPDPCLWADGDHHLCDNGTYRAG